MENGPLRIAFATCEYVTENYFYGGLANYTHRVAKALAGMGHDVHVLTLSEIDGAEFEHEGVRVHRVTPGRVAEREGVRNVRVIRSPFYTETEALDGSVYERHLRGKQYLLFFGRFQLHKGFHTLADALPRFLEQCLDAHVALVGQDGPTPLAPSMAAYARTRCGRFAERLVLPGNLPHAQLYPVIEGARLVVLPSLLDSFPNVCLEALGLGKPVVGTKGTGLDEMIEEDETGFLVPPGDAGALADGLMRAWAHPGLARMGEAARLKASEFSPERTVAALVEYYREVLRAPDGKKAL